MPTSIEGLLIVALVLVPGFIFTLILMRTIAYIQTSEVRFLLTIITLGIVTHALPFLWTVRIIEYHSQGALLDHSPEVFAWGLVTMFAVPTALGIFAGWLSGRSSVDTLLERIGFSYIDRLPSAWDYVILKQRGFYVKIHLKDDRGVIGGVYSQDSFASTEPLHQDMFIEQVWQLNEDGNFVRPVYNTRGSWISKQAMDYIEFFVGEDKPHEPEKPQDSNDDES